MSLDLELKELAKLGLEGFNKAVGATLTVSDLDIIIRRPTVGSLINILFVTKASGDDVRFQLNVINFGSAVGTKLFTLKLRPNSASGDNSDEVYIADCELTKEIFPNIWAYSESVEYQEFIDTKPYILDNQNRQLQFESGFNVLLQR